MSAHDRHLAAILFTDIVCYTAIMQHDEVRAMELVNRYHTVLKSSVSSHCGKIINDYGDGSLCTFPSALEAVNCAIELQSMFREQPVVPLRIGLHIGEIFLENRKVFGDGVNVASRIQSLGQANTILFSGEILNKIKNHPEFKTMPLGKFDFKNVDDPMEVFALANEGLTVPKRNEMSGKLKYQKWPFTRKGVATASAFIILILLAFLVYRQTSNKTKFETIEKSIAVLPFTDLSSTHDQGYLSEGVADEIQNRLCKFNDLKVAGKTSSFSFKGKNLDLKTIGERLNVKNILEGSVHKEGDQIRINIQLSNSATGFSLFSESYSSDMKNILTLQSNIAIDIAEKIKSKLSASEKKLLNVREINPRAYETYLKGRAQFVNGPFSHPEDLFMAKKYFEAAVAMDTSFAEAYAFLAISFFNLFDWAYPASEPNKRKSALDSAQLFAKKAILLDPNNSSAHLAMGSVYYHQFKWVEAEKEKRKAVELDPGGAFEKFELASFLSQFNQKDEAIQLDTQGIRLDPLNPYNKAKYVMDLFRVRQYDECIRQGKIALLENPNSGVIYMALGYCYWCRQDYGKTLNTWAKMHELSGNYKLAETFKNSDFKTAMYAIIKSISEFENGTVIDFATKALVYALLQDKENTFKYLNLATDNNQIFTALRTNQAFDFIRNDPRYLVVYEKFGFKAYDDYKASEKKYL